VIQSAKAADVVEGEAAKPLEIPELPAVEVVYSPDQPAAPVEGFGAGILDEP